MALAIVILVASLMNTAAHRIIDLQTAPTNYPITIVPPIIGKAVMITTPITDQAMMITVATSHTTNLSHMAAMKTTALLTP